MSDNNNIDNIDDNNIGDDIDRLDADTAPEAEGFDDDGAPFDEFEGGGEGTLGELFRTNPLVKVGVVLGAFVLLVGGIILFGGSDEREPISSVGAGSDINAVPGDEVSQSYREAVEESNVQAVEDAVREGTSALPVPVSSPQGRVDLAATDGEGEDPLERWRRIQEERQRRDTQQVPQQQQTGDPNAEAISQLASAMADQMGSILENNQPRSMQSLDVAQIGFLEEQREKAAAAAREAAMPTAEQEAVLNIIIPAGTVEYAQLLIEANSDAPGPVLAQIASGPLSGSRLLGSFQTTEEYLVLTFDQVVIDGISYDVEAVALDPKTTTPGMVTEIDRRYFRRIVLPAAGAFIEGVAEAFAETGSNDTVVTNGVVVTDGQDEPNTDEAIASGIEEGASKMTDILDEEASRTKVLVRVAAGTPMGVLFVEPVTKDEIN